MRCAATITMRVRIASFGFVPELGVNVAGIALDHRLYHFRLFERLRDEHGFAGSDTVVKDYVRVGRAQMRDARSAISSKSRSRGVSSMS